MIKTFKRLLFQNHWAVFAYVLQEIYGAPHNIEYLKSFRWIINRPLMGRVNLEKGRKSSDAATL